jgi:Mg-chelatase subunit ChlD
LKKVLANILVHRKNEEANEFMFVVGYSGSMMSKHKIDLA